MSETTTVIHDLMSRKNDQSMLVRFGGGDAFTGAESVTLATTAATVLAESGASPGSRVALMMNNCPGFAWSYLGAMCAGLIPVPINTALHGQLLGTLLAQIEPSVTVVSEDYLEAITGCGADPGRILTVHSEQPSPGRSAAKAHDFEDVMSRAGLSEPVATSVHDAACILYTSGTTGPSKGAIYSHGMISEFADFGDWIFGLDENDVMYNCLPMFHANALVLTLCGAIRSGGGAVIGDRFSAATYWKEVVDYGATVLSFLGSMYPILLNQEKQPEESEHHARVALAVPSPPSNMAAFEDRFGIKLTTLYGLSDMAMPIGVPHGTAARPGKAGIPHPDWEVALRDESGNEVGPDTPGEMVIRPRRTGIMPLGYWRNSEATVQTWRDLWFHTGDILSVDSEGWFTFVDRSKDKIRRSGENVSSFEVETVLQDAPGVEEVAVYGVPAEMGEDEVMVAVVVGTEWSGPAELVGYAEERLPYFAVPRYVRELDAMPKTPTAKIRKEQLRAEAVVPDVYDAGPRGRKHRASRRDRS